MGKWEKIMDVFRPVEEYFEKGIQHVSTIIQRGDLNYHTHRIPGIVVCPNNTIIIFFEARKDSSSDFGEIDLGMRKSRDGGVTWEKPSIILKMNKLAIQNPCPIYDSETKKIVLGLLVDRKKFYIMESEDFGDTWTEPRFLENLFNSEYSVNGCSPGHGLQLQSGRLLFPGMFNEGEKEVNGRILDHGEWNSNVYLSDDHGQTWVLGHEFNEHSDESIAAQLRDGTVLMILRQSPKNPESHRIMIASSDDEGRSFGKGIVHSDLITPICMVGFLRIDHQSDHEGDCLLISTPYSEKERRYLTILASLDGGKSWPIKRLIFRGKTSYSDMAQLPDGRIAIVFEGGKKWSTDRIFFGIIDVKAADWLYRK